MRRIISLLAVLAIMAAMVVASAMPAFASHERIAPERAVVQNGPFGGKALLEYSDRDENGSPFLILL